MQLRLAFHEARSEADKISGSNLGVKEQEIVIARLTEQVNAKKWFFLLDWGLTDRKFLEQLRDTNPVNLQNGHSDGESMEIDMKAENAEGNQLLKDSLE